MRALETGRLSPDDPDAARHLDRCLGCRGCEPVCPAGVGYGHGLEEARARRMGTRGLSTLARVALHALTAPPLSSMAYALGRWLRATGIPRRMAGWSRPRFALGMLAATAGRTGKATAPILPRRSPSLPVSLFRGCVMEGLFPHVHDATVRTLRVNGYDVGETAGQVCCGALHAHAGLRQEARALARANVAAFGPGDAPVAVNSAGCGAMLKTYGHLLPDDPGAARLAARARDVTELLAERGPVPGAPLDLRVTYDPPCHLLHAQRVADAPARLFAAIPVLRLVPIADAAQCCGSAGLFTLLEPEMSRAVLAPKIEQLRRAAPRVVATGNPGCLMQLGAGLRASGIAADARHPVELLDESYRAAGYYL